jgi:hypothetical protein
LHATTIYNSCRCFAFIKINAQNNLPVYNNAAETNYSKDWLVTPVAEKAAIYKSSDANDIILYNGLVKRSFRLQPNLPCIDYKNMSNGQQLLRAIKPEAEITINGISYMWWFIRTNGKCIFIILHGLIHSLHMTAIFILFLMK